MNHVNTFLQWAIDIMASLHLPLQYQNASATALVVFTVLLISGTVYYIFSRIIAKAVHLVVSMTTITWDDLLLNPKMVKVFSQLIFVIMLNALLPDSFELYPEWQKWIVPMLEIMVVIMGAALLNQLLLAAYEIICTETRLPAQSLKGIRQMLQLVVFIIATIILISILVNKSPVIILSGLGASAAVLMLVFKDSILGLVAGIQLTANDMLKPGDWITAPKYGANGVVQEVTLTTVKVQNFDMTIVTIPPYSLVSEAFQNWKGMQLSAGRRIMRSIFIDANSVRFLSTEEASKFSDEEWGKPLDWSRPQVNLTVYRAYLEHHIKRLSTCVDSMTAMVRELQPTAQGIPVEIYFFTSSQEWVAYEHVQADVIDHIVASVHDFGLRLYQAPSGLDVLALKAQ